MTLRPEGTADKTAFEKFLEEGVPGLLRLKGFVSVSDMSPQAVVQWTAGSWDLLKLPSTMSAKPDVLVFIGEHLDRELISQKLTECGLKLTEHAHEH